MLPSSRRAIVAAILLVAAASAAPVFAATVPATPPAAHASDAPLAPQGPEIAAARPATPSRITIFNREIATLRVSLKGFSPEDRANAAERRIGEQIADDVFEPVTVAPASDGAVAVSLGGKWMFYVLPGDVDAPAGETAESVARHAASQLAEALAAVREQRSVPRTLRSVAVSIGTLLVMIAVVRVFGAVRRRGRVWWRRIAMRRVRKVDVMGLPVITRIRLQRFEHVVVTFVGRVARVLLAYFWFVFALHQFPFTRPWAREAHRFVLDATARLALTLVGTLPGLVVVIAILLLARWLASAIGSVFTMVETRRIEVPWFHPDLVQPTRRIVAGVLWVFAVVLAYPFIPFSESMAFKGVSVFIGLMVSFGSSGVVSQGMSGFVLMYSRALRPGEFVRIGEVEGTVTSLGILSTKIRTPRGEEATIPNSVVVGTSTKNYSRLADEHGLLLNTSVTIGYDTPWRQVHALLIKAAERTPGLLAQPAPFVLQTALSDFYVEYQLLARLGRPEMRPFVLSALHENIQDQFNEHGVQIMSPHYLGDPATEKVVPEERWFEPPATPARRG